MGEITRKKNRKKRGKRKRGKSMIELRENKDRKLAGGSRTNCIVCGAQYKMKM